MRETSELIFPSGPLEGADRTEGDVSYFPASQNASQKKDASKLSPTSICDYLLMTLRESFLSLVHVCESHLIRDRFPNHPTEIKAQYQPLVGSFLGVHWK